MLTVDEAREILLDWVDLYDAWHEEVLTAKVVARLSVQPQYAETLADGLCDLEGRMGPQLLNLAYATWRVTRNYAETESNTPECAERAADYAQWYTALPAAIESILETVPGPPLDVPVYEETEAGQTYLGDDDIPF